MSMPRHTGWSMSTRPGIHAHVVADDVTSTAGADPHVHQAEARTVRFSEARLGDEAFTYERVDGTPIDDHAWVGDLEYFDERDGPEHLLRKRWVLVEVAAIVLPDPLDNYGA